MTDPITIIISTKDGQTVGLNITDFDPSQSKGEFVSRMYDPPDVKLLDTEKGEVYDLLQKAITEIVPYVEKTGIKEGILDDVTTWKAIEGEQR
jgi:hypothetical protein